MRAFCWWLVAAAALAAAGRAAAAPADADLSSEDAPPPTTTPEPEDAPAPAEALQPTRPRQLQRRKDGSLPPECNSTLGVPCFPKCCPVGQTYYGTKCEPTNVTFEPFITNYTYVDDGMDLSKWDPESYFLVIGNPCKEWTYVNYSEIDMWSNGQLYLYYNEETSTGETLDPVDFCLEYSERDTEAFFCLDPPDVQRGGLTNVLYTSGMLVSVSGLLLTLFVYLAVDALRDLHGKSLVCHVGCLAIAYTLLAAVQLSGDTNFGASVCRRMAFAIQFFLLGSFLWLHVMCLDACWCVLEATGCSPIPYPRAKSWVWNEMKKQWVTGLDMNERDEMKEEERKRRDKMVERRVFVGYSIYVWSLTFLPVIVVLARGLNPTIPATYVDHNMREHCELLEDKTKESLLYFYPFTSMVIILNIVIFVCILIKAVRFKWNAIGPQRVPKQKARMCFLLFVLMSSNWVIDLISWFLGGKQLVWVMLHAFYILQGLITFLIFVLEDRVKDRIIYKLWPGIKRVSTRYGCCHDEIIEEEVIALRNPPSDSQSFGWVRPN